MSGRSTVAETLRLPDAEALADLATLAGRARRADPDGAARLVAHGDVLAVYVSPVHGGGGPLVLGLRVLRLDVPSAVDVTVTLTALSEATAAAGPPAGQGERPGDGPGARPRPATVVLPVGSAPAAGWVGVSPPRQGWQPAGAVAGRVVADAASAGIAEVARGAPTGSGAAAVAALRARVWGRPLAPDLPELPCGVAFGAVALGFLDAAEPVAVYRCGPWWRVTASAGHVLARASALL